MKRQPRVRALKLAAQVRERLTAALGKPVKNLEVKSLHKKQEFLHREVAKIAKKIF